jgi:hypothetical protein
MLVSVRIANLYTFLDQIRNNRFYTFALVFRHWYAASILTLTIVNFRT